MKKIHIEKGGLSATVLPDFGGMVSALSVDGVEVLRMDEGQLGTANVLSGGIPVLFPFVSRCRDDEATFRGERHTMPAHGFAKDMSFAVEGVWDGGCRLLLRSSPATKRLYPFDFALSLTYEIEGHALATEMRVENLSDAPLPFAAGFHPYFATPDRAQASLRMELRECWDFLRFDAEGNPAHIACAGDVRLADEYDAVFWGGCADCCIESRDVGYRARIACGDDFPVVTVCTMLPGASCVEPWQARPGAAERPDECRVLAPGASGSYRYAIELEKL